MVDIPTREPSQVRAGDSVQWTKSAAGYLPADSWVLAYALVNSAERIEITATDNGDGSHLVDESPATSAAWTPGEYSWHSYATKGSARHTVGTGRIEILPDFATATDARTHVKKTLDAIEAVIENRASSDQLAYSIAGRSISKMSPEQLLTLRDRYKAEYVQEVAQERQAQGLGSSKKILVRFR